MKKLLLTLILITGFSFAQDSTSSPWGVYGGITSSSMSDSDGRTTGLSLGFSRTLNDKWSWGSGLSHRGAKIDDIEGTVELKGNAVELWSSYSLIQFEYFDQDRSVSFDLSTGLIYAHIYEFEAKMDGVSVSWSDTDNDYGLFLNGTIPLQENLALNLGYYMGLRDMGDDTKFNNLWLEVGYSF